MKAMKRPMPAEMALLRNAGMDEMILLRRGLTAMTRNSTPLRSTMARASCQVYPMPKHTVKVKKALSPMPGAWAKGALASRAVSRHPMAALMQVASMTPLASIPVWESIWGLTKMM